MAAASLGMRPEGSAPMLRRYFRGGSGGVAGAQSALALRSPVLARPIRSASRCSREGASRDLRVGVFDGFIAASLDHVLQALFADLAVERRAADAEEIGRAHV